MDSEREHMQYLCLASTWLLSMLKLSFRIQNSGAVMELENDLVWAGLVYDV